MLRSELLAEAEGARDRALAAGLDPRLALAAGLEFLERAAREGRGPTSGELLQAAAMLLVAAETAALRRKPPGNSR